MIKLIAIGLWVCAVSLGSSYVMASMGGEADAAPAPEPTYFAGLDYRKTDPITVPMISDVALEGYVLARFVYTIDGKTLSELKVPPDPFVMDSGFRRIYSLEGFSFAEPRRYDLKVLTAAIRDDVNAAFGQKLVEEVLVEQFDYVARADIRGRNAVPAAPGVVP